MIKQVGEFRNMCRGSSSGKKKIASQSILERAEKIPAK